MTVPPMIQGANHPTTGINYASHAPSTNYMLYSPPLLPPHPGPASPASPGLTGHLPRGFLLHRPDGAVIAVLANGPEVGDLNTLPASQVSSRTASEYMLFPDTSSMETRAAQAALPQAMLTVHPAPAHSSSRVSRSLRPIALIEQAYIRTVSSIVSRGEHPHVDANSSRTNEHSLSEDDMFGASHAAVRHSHHPGGYLADGRTIAAPQPVCASAHRAYGSGYVGTIRADALGLELPSLIFQENADTDSAMEQQYEKRMVSVYNPPSSRFNERLRKISPPAIQLRPRTPTHSSMPAALTDVAHCAQGERGDITSIHYPPSTQLLEYPDCEEGVQSQPVAPPVPLLGVPVIPDASVPGPPSAHVVPASAAYASNAWVQVEEHVRRWAQMHATQPATPHEDPQAQSPREPPPVRQHCAELPPITALPPLEHVGENDEQPPAYSSLPALAFRSWEAEKAHPSQHFPGTVVQQTAVRVSSTDERGVQASWPFALPALASPMGAQRSQSVATRPSRSSFALPEISTPPAAALDAPMELDPPAYDAEAAVLSPLEIRFARPLFTEWEGMAAQCANAVGDMRWILTSCKELALHEINAVIEALTGAILAVRDAMAEAPRDPTELDQGHGREWARKYEVILSSCRRNLDILTLQAEHIRDRPPRIHKFSGLLDKLWRYVEKFEDLERKLRIMHDHIAVLHLYARLRESRQTAAAEVATERARRRAFSDAGTQARDHRREVRSEIRRMRDDAHARREVRAHHKMRRAEDLGGTFVV